MAESRLSPGPTTLITTGTCALESSPAWPLSPWNSGCPQQVLTKYQTQEALFTTSHLTRRKTPSPAGPKLILVPLKLLREQGQGLHACRPPACLRPREAKPGSSCAGVGLAEALAPCTHSGDPTIAGPAGLALGLRPAFSTCRIHSRGGVII